MKKIINKLLLTAVVLMSGCTSLPKETVELSEVTGYQITALHESHIGFIELYYGKLREDINDFIDEKWTPLFLSKAINNLAFRADLDAAYLTSNIKASDISITWRGKEIKDPQKSIVLQGVETAVTDEKAKLGDTLLEWSEEAQYQINKKRHELLKPVNEQEKMVISEINGAFFDLQRSQAAIKGYLASAVDLREKSNEILQKLGALERVGNVMNAITDANEKVSTILGAKDGAQKALKDFLIQIEASSDNIMNAANKKIEGEK